MTKINPKEKIIVIGDLFIDENWLMAKTDNYHSTDVGDNHYNSLVKGPDSFVMSVCGIANVLKVLSGKDQKHSINSKYDVIGVGAWNPDDTEIVKSILCANKEIKQRMTPFTLTNYLQEIVHTRCKDIACLECGLEYELRNLVHDDNMSTNRIYRIYEGFGSDLPKLRYRFDWQMDLKESSLDYKTLSDIKNVKAIIIVDHGKGVVNESLIRKLLEKHKGARWYVRTKLKSPPWLKHLKRARVSSQLIVVDQQLIDYIYGVRIWKRSTSLCRASLELLGNMLGLKTYQHGEEIESSIINSKNTAILFKDNWAIAGSRHNGIDARIFYFPKSSHEKMAIRVGRTSIFFNSLVYWDLMINDLNGNTMPQATEWALSNMTEWMRKCTEAWKDEKPSGLSGPFEEVISWFPTRNIKPREGMIYERYRNSWAEWNLSSIKQGVLTYKIERGKGKTLVKKSPADHTDKMIREFHLWRSYGTLPNYVCPGGEKRSNINNLVRSLNEYSKSSNPVVPFNCLFIAEPGWGKSYLAQCLSNYFNFDFLSYSIAQMSTTKELIDSFKEIASTQKRTSKKVLVFMDEIDAQITGETAMGLLLSPMWGGKFKSEGYTNKIDPCIWIFACTKPLKIIRELPKGRDFLSRINGPTINVDFLNDNYREEIHAKDIAEDKRNKKLKDQLATLSSISQESKDDKRTEIVYQMVNLLNTLYGPISSIDSDVLKLFYNILPINGVRSLQIFASKFKNITKGIIKKKNVPYLIDNKELEGQIELLYPEEYITAFKGDKVEAEGDIIRIKLLT